MNNLNGFLMERAKTLLFHPRKRMLATFAAMLCLMVMMPMSARAQGHDYSQDYLTFNVINGGTIPWKLIGTDSSMAKTISYSVNNGAWTSITASSSASISVVAGDVVRFKGSNSAFAKDKNNYSAFYGGTASYNVEGNIMSLIYGDNFNEQTTLSSTWALANVFNHSNVISAENLIMPATTLSQYCYRATFANCPSLTTPPQLPATTLANGCYYYMFDNCVSLLTAPDLLASTLVKECYYGMFHGCSIMNHIKCIATSGFSTTNPLYNWTGEVAASGTFVKDENTPITSGKWTRGANGIPTNWTVVDDGTPDIPTISCDGSVIELSCTTTGAVIYYQLNHSGNYTQYTIAIPMTGDTFIECYSEKDGNTSATISQTCVYDNRTIFEYSNQSLDTWTYNGNTITTPYSVNAIDGHSSYYARGTFNFETDVNLRSQQPTYLWFQHADQSASIYVDDNLVEKHWGGYNAFFVDISGFVHKGTNHIKVALKNNEGNNLAPAAGDFNFNATLGKVKLFTSPYLPSMSYGYDGFHITSTVSSASATINVKTTIPAGATVVCTIIGDNCNYSDTQTSDGTEMTFTKTITSPHLWNGTIDPYLYNVKLEIYHDNELYHKYERPYGLRFFEYVFDETVNGNSYTGFLLNGQPYLLRGVCVHDDLANKANALNDDDYTQEFNIITELGCNFLRLAHYPHPKEVYDKCDQLGIIVQTEAPWVNKSTIDETEDYWTHLEGQCADMVNQHYNHPCIMFWGVGNEINTNYTNSEEGRNLVKSKIEGYRNIIRTLLPGAMVGYTVSHNTSDLLTVFNSPNVDWVGGNIYVGWYIQTTSNDPTGELNKRITKTITNASVPCAFSEYGGGGTQACHSDDFMATTTTGNNPRHDIEYQMWLHEGHIAAIKDKPELIFTSQWQLFDIAVSNRQEGYKVCLDGETVFDNDELKRLNNKGLVERDHVTKKDTYYLYKAWWNTTDKFVHICGKNYLNTEDRVIKCYTNDGSELTLYVNGASTQTVTVTDNIATFTARSFNDGDVIMVSGATTNDTFTIHNYGENVFVIEGDWDTDSNWSGSAVPADGSNVVIAAKATIPADYVANAGEISINGGSITIADGGQLLHSNEGVTATVEKNIQAWTTTQNAGEDLTDGWYFIASPTSSDFTPTSTMLSNEYDLYRLNNTTWENWKQTGDHYHFALENGHGYLYANNTNVTLGFTGEIVPSNANQTVPVSAGYNLVGNPFVCNAYINQNYYTLNSERNAIQAMETTSDNAIAPCTGVIVEAENDGSVTFSKDYPVATSNNGRLQITLTQANMRSNAMMDNAIITFNEGSQLGKFYFGTQNANIYLPQGKEDYAIAFSDKQGEMPLNFKAKENGSYMLTVNPEDVEMAYLHLIDNKTGVDVDLLLGDCGSSPAMKAPSYTFTAKTTDYESRFRLVFSANDGNGASTGSGTFAFISNGNIIVTDAEAGDMLQILDVTGRVIRCSDAINRVSTSGMTPGVYVLRLISGHDVKTQKIVVR